MKRIQNACLEQTIVFSVRESFGIEEDRRINREELAHYKMQMAKKHVRYEILSEEECQDGALKVKIRRQYNQYPCSEYIKD